MIAPKTSWHYTPNANIVNGRYVPGTDGFNLADVSSVDELTSLPLGTKALVWLGMGDGVTSAFKAAVSQYIGNPKLYGFYLADEPDPSQIPAANLKAESDWIHAHVPGAKTFIVMQNFGSDTHPSYANTYNPANSHIDLYGIDPYPVRPEYAGGADYNVIPAAVSAAKAAGIPLADIVPVYQDFGGGGYSSWTMPTASQEEKILAAWGAAVPTAAFDYAYSWGTQSGDSALSSSSALQQVSAAHNLRDWIVGRPYEGETLTARVNVSKTLGSVSYQWQRLVGVVWTNILGATGSTYRLAERDEGHQLRAIATYRGASGVSAWAATTACGVTDPPPVLTVSRKSLTVQPGGAVAMGMHLAGHDSDDAVTVRITGLPSYETITDHIDKTVFSGPVIELTSAEVNSGLVLHSHYTGSGSPTAHLSLVAWNLRPGEITHSAVQTIAVTDPPAEANGHETLFSAEPPGCLLETAAPELLREPTPGALDDRLHAAGTDRHANEWAPTASPSIEPLLQHLEAFHDESAAGALWRDHSAGDPVSAASGALHGSESAWPLQPHWSSPWDWGG